VLPKLMATRSGPLGASSLTTLGEAFCAMAPVVQEKMKDDAKANDASALIMMRVLGNPAPD
jgi:hypothetical protein